jgi:hypothetical protein
LRLLGLILATRSASPPAPVAPAIATILEPAFAVAAVTSLTSVAAFVALAISELLLPLRLATAARIALGFCPYRLGPICWGVRAWRRPVRAPGWASIALIGAWWRRRSRSFGLRWRRAAIDPRRWRRFDFDGALLTHAFGGWAAFGVIEIRVVRRLGGARIGWTFPASATWGASTFSHAVVEVRRLNQFQLPAYHAGRALIERCPN